MKRLLIIGLVMTILMALVVSVATTLAHEQERFNRHPVDRESCESALEGVYDQLENRGTVNPRLVANAESKCGLNDGGLLACLEAGGFLTWVTRPGFEGMICLVGTPVPPPGSIHEDSIVL
jgi:Tfp pilus assembly protein PilX